MKFKMWIPRDQDPNQPSIVRLYFESDKWVGMKRTPRSASGSYERHRATKGEIQFNPAVFQFGGFSEEEAHQILEKLRAKRIEFLRRLKIDFDEAKIGIDEVIEFAEIE